MSTADLNKKSHVYNAIYIFSIKRSDKMGSYFTLASRVRQKVLHYSPFLFNLTLHCKPTMTQDDQNKGLAQCMSLICVKCLHKSSQ